MYMLCIGVLVGALIAIILFSGGVVINNKHRDTARQLLFEAKGTYKDAVTHLQKLKVNISEDDRKYVDYAVKCIEFCDFVGERLLYSFSEDK